MSSTLRFVRITRIQAVAQLYPQTNTTQTLKGPTVKDPMAIYFASTDALVQLSASGSVSYLPYTPGSTSASASASWSVVSKLPSSTPSGNGSTTSVTGSSTSTAAGVSSTNGGSGRSSGGVSSGRLSVGVSVSWGMASALLFNWFGC